MSRFVRQSKVRNIYPDLAKPEQTFRGFKFKQPGATDTQGIKTNDTYMAISVSTGGGSIAIEKLDNPSRIAPSPPVLFHSSFVVDFDFNPFHSNLIASGTDAGNIFVWGIPDGGLTSNIDEPVVEFEGIHDKSVNNILFHPTASHVLASGSLDGTVKMFDVEHEKEVFSVDHPDPVLHISFSPDGQTLASTCKDKKLRLIDARSGEVTSEKVAHPGPKTVKSIFLEKTGNGTVDLATVGFTVQSKRQLKLWDSRKLSNEVSKQDIDSTNSVFMPFYDSSLKILYLQGRGETKTFIYELVDEAPHQFNVYNDPVSKGAVRGACMLPKRCVNVMRDGGHQNKGPEVDRMYQVTSGAVTPVAWVIPRKNTKFWPELFTDAYAGIPTLTAEEFFEGKKSSKPKKVGMDPRKKKGDKGGAEKKKAAFGGGAAASFKGSSKADLEAEIARLKKILDQHKIKY